MRILIIASGNSAKMSPFVREQAESLIKKGVSVDFFLIKDNHGPCRQTQTV